MSLLNDPVRERVLDMKSQRPSTTQLNTYRAASGPTKPTHLIFFVENQNSELDTCTAFPSLLAVCSRIPVDIHKSEPCTTATTASDSTAGAVGGPAPYSTGTMSRPLVSKHISSSSQAPSILHTTTPKRSRSFSKDRGQDHCSEISRCAIQLDDLRRQA